MLVQYSKLGNLAAIDFFGRIVLPRGHGDISKVDGRKTLRCMVTHGWLDNCHSMIPLLSRLPFIDHKCDDDGGEHKSGTNSNGNDDNNNNNNGNENVKNSNSDDQVVDVHFHAIDFTGHGRSDPLITGTYGSVIEHSSDILSEADRLGWEKFHILGHSMGGASSSVVAGSFPERVESLFLIDGIMPLVFDPSDAAARFRKGHLSRVKTDPRERLTVSSLDAAAKRIQETRRGLSYESARFLTLRAVTPGSDTSAYVSSSAADRAVSLNCNNSNMFNDDDKSILADAVKSRRPEEFGFTGTDDDPVTWANDPKLRASSISYMTMEQTMSFARGIKCPVTLVRQKNLPWFQKNAIEEWTAAMDDTEVHNIDDGHHHMHMDEPWCSQIADLIVNHFDTRLHSHQ